MIGRDSVLSSLGGHQLSDELQMADASDTMKAQLQAALKAMDRVIQYDSEGIVSLGTKRPLRAGTHQDYKIGDGVVVFMTDRRLKEQR